MTRRALAVASGSRRSRGAGLFRITVASAVVVLAAAGGIWALTNDGREGAAARAVSSLDVSEVGVGSFDITTTAMGELAARHQIELRSQLDTRAGIVEIVPEGTVVKKGDLLVQLNAEELQDQIDQQKLEVERAQADVTAAEAALTIQLSENESKKRAGQLKVDLAKLALQQWRDGEVVKTRKQLQLDIEQADRDLTRLKEQFERSVSLLAEGFLSKNERDQDEIDYINAQARLETARLDQRVYAEYQHPRDEKTKLSDLEEAEADLARVLEQNAINAAAKRSSLDTANRQLQLKTERLEKMQSQFELATIRAPTDGLVVYSTSLDRDRGFFDSEGPLQVGREVRPNELLIILPDTSSMVATVRVHESLAGRIRPGQRSIVKVDALANETFFGTVESIGVLAESGGWRDPNRREYSVRIAISHDNSDGVLKPSMRAEGTITLGTVRDALMVPVQAVFSEGPVRYVLRPAGSRFQRVPVQVGRTSDVYAEITSGLEGGQRVLLREPTSGEIVNTAWSATELEAVGLALDESGKPYSPRAREAAAQMMQGMPEFTVLPGGPQGTDEQGAARGERGPRRERPGGAGPQGARGNGEQTEVKPTEGATPQATATEAAAETTEGEAGGAKDAGGAGETAEKVAPAKE